MADSKNSHNNYDHNRSLGEIVAADPPVPVVPKTVISRAPRSARSRLRPSTTLDLRQLHIDLGQRGRQLRGLVVTRAATQS